MFISIFSSFFRNSQMSISVCSLCDSGMPEILKLCRLSCCSRSSVLMSVWVILSSRCTMSCFKGCITSAIWFSRDRTRCSIGFAFISGIPTSADTKRSIVSLLLSAPRTASRSTSASSPIQMFPWRGNVCVVQTQGPKIQCFVVYFFYFYY